jgi:hypothetical protein
MAASNTKFKVENGLDVVGTANVSGSLRVEQDLIVVGNLSFTAVFAGDVNPTVDNQYNIGNATFRWAGANVVNFYANTATVLNTLTTSQLTSNTIVPTSNTNASLGSATRLWNLTANGVTAVTSNVTGNSVVLGTAASFNANTGVNGTTDYITTLSAHGFTNGEFVQYTVAAGNTALSGLSNASYYFVVGANSTAFQLSTTYGGSNVNITASATSETGHTLTPVKITLSSNGSVLAPAGIANVGTLRVLGATSLTGAATVNGIATFNANVVIDTDLIFADAFNNLIGLKNNAPSTVDLVTVTGNVFFNTANTGVRFGSTANASQNASIIFNTANTSNSRLTFTTYDNSNSTVFDGGFLFQSVNSTATAQLVQFTSNSFTYKTGNVAHAGNFGIYNVSGTRVGP